MKPYPYYTTREVHSIGDILKYRLENTPEKDAFRVRIDKDNYKSISWRQFGADIEALSASLCARSLVSAHICVIGENSYEWVVVFFAVIMSGGVIVPLDRELPAPKLKELIAFSDAKAIFYSGTYNGAMADIRQELTEVKYFSVHDTNSGLPMLLNEGTQLLESGERSCRDVEIDTEKLAAIYFTSGTSGEQKGVMLCQRNMVASFDGACKHVHFSDDDVVLSVLPLHHCYESNCGILALLHHGCVICFNENLKVFLSNLKLFRPTGISLVPLVADTLFRQIMDAAQRNGKLRKLQTGMKISDLLQKLNIDITEKLFGEVYEALGGRYRKSFVGGTPMNPIVTKAFRQLGITMLQGYGITECSPLVSVNRENFFKDDSVGPVLPVCRVKIKDGEVLVKGDNVMLGYYKNEQATHEAMDEGWFKTGDLGYIDMDGFLYITGRKKNLIILESGENVSPEELEGYVVNLPLVSEVVVYEDGNNIMAEIFPDADYAKESDITDIETELMAQITDINKGLPRYKHIHGLRLRDSEFEKTTSKKIIRYKVHAD